MKSSNTGSKLHYGSHALARAPNHTSMARRAAVYLRLLVCAFCLSFGSYGLAENYTFVEQSCDLRGMKDRLRENPESSLNRYNYSRCLVIDGETAQGMRDLYDLRDYDNEILAADFIADHIYSVGRLAFHRNGDFIEDVLEIDIDKALKARFHVLALINNDYNYPAINHETIDYVGYESRTQLELWQYRLIPGLFLDKFIKGVVGHHNDYILRSPSYRGPRDLELSRDYSPYTLDSLDRAIEQASECLGVRQKRHFKPSTYATTRKACQIMQESARTLIPLEKERLELTNRESCNRDVLKCERLDRLVSKIRSLYIKQHGDIHKILASS